MLITNNKTKGNKLNTVTITKWTKNLKTTTMNKLFNLGKSRCIDFNIVDEDGNKIKFEIWNRDGQISTTYTKHIANNNNKTKHTVNTKSFDDTNIIELNTTNSSIADIQIWESK